jgi:hypothetical protein
VCQYLEYTTPEYQYVEKRHFGFISGKENLEMESFTGKGKRA